MRHVFGRQPASAPPGTFREIHFPMLGHLDRGTREGILSRQLVSSGADARELPRSGYFQFQQDVGHFGSIAAYALHEITVDGETGEFSGKGWLADNEAGHATEIAVVSKSLYNNSVDLGDMMDSDIEVIMHGDFWDDNFWAEVNFLKWSVIATTLVGKEAFAGSHAVIPGEILAALGQPEPLIVDCPTEVTANLPVEIFASMDHLPSWDYFNRPESDTPHKIIVGVPDEYGWIPVYGNLAQWNQRHLNYAGVAVYPPRPRKGYREFNQPGVLTDRGQVETGPIVLYGGHISLKEAADNPRNAWADVKVTAGKHGPWVCGVVRPRVAQNLDQVYDARCSDLSGHWLNDDLKMIISCNRGAFPQDGLGHDAMREGELVASFDAAPAGVPKGLLSFTEMSAEDHADAMSWLKARKDAGQVIYDTGVLSAKTITTLAGDAEPEFDPELEQWRLAEELALEDDEA